MNMKKCNKFKTGLISGILIGIVGGVILTPRQRTNIRNVILFRARKVLGFLYDT